MSESSFPEGYSYLSESESRPIGPEDCDLHLLTPEEMKRVLDLMSTELMNLHEAGDHSEEAYYPKDIIQAKELTSQAYTILDRWSDYSEIPADSTQPTVTFAELFHHTTDGIERQLADEARDKAQLNEQFGSIILGSGIVPISFDDLTDEADETPGTRGFEVFSTIFDEVAMQLGEKGVWPGRIADIL